MRSPPVARTDERGVRIFSRTETTEKPKARFAQHGGFDKRADWFRDPDRNIHAIVSG